MPRTDAGVCSGRLSGTMVSGDFGSESGISVALSQDAAAGRKIHLQTSDVEILETAVQWKSRRKEETNERMKK